ncbi:hypothetical protein SAMN04487992_102150 [Cellulophaga baltica]|uniref:Uncharacterized protein n=1 Tax=Cellulophaga baltica TaxID=76594 RepID=A0A1G7E805_9FLAO|nr:hypothetical protein SAMN04487992_102150 [Cellulophaga baltica]
MKISLGFFNGLKTGSSLAHYYELKPLEFYLSIFSNIFTTHKKHNPLYGSHATNFTTLKIITDET